MIGDDSARKLDLDVGNSKRWLVDHNCRSAGWIVGERDLPWAFSSAPIFNEMVNEDVAEQCYGKCDNKMFGWVIAFHLHGGFSDGDIEQSGSERRMVEPRGVEPLTFSLRTRRSTN